MLGFKMLWWCLECRGGVWNGGMVGWNLEWDENETCRLNSSQNCSPFLGCNFCKIISTDSQTTVATALGEPIKAEYSPKLLQSLYPGLFCFVSFFF